MSRDKLVTQYLRTPIYLVSDFDEENKDDDDEQVVNDANCSDDDVCS